MNETSKITFFHPAIRPYRSHIYLALQRDFISKFYFLGFKEVNEKWIKYYGIKNYEIFPEKRFIGYRSGVNFDILKRAIEEDYEVWISSMLYAFTTHFVCPIVKRRGRKFVLWSEDWYWGGDLLSQLAIPVCKAIMKRADAIIVAGSKQRDFFLENNVPESKLRIAYNSFVPMESNEIREKNVEKNVYDKKKFRVLYLGRLLEYKGLDWLIESYGHLESKYPEQTELLIVGTGPFENACKTLVRRLHLCSVRFMGGVEPEEVREFYRFTDVFVHPCRWWAKRRVRGESWGFVINEAMSMGLPVITTSAVGSAYDLIEDGKSGIILSPGDRLSLTRTLESLYRDPGLRVSIGRAARDRIYGLFTPEKQSSAFVDAIRSLP